MTKMKAFTLTEVAQPHLTFGNVSKSAFTLAEVLITLGIIGVVAAMTMPTLMNSTNGAQYKTAYKKALSVISQAVVMNVALDDYDMSQAASTATDGQSLYKMFKSRMNVIKTGTGDEYTVVGTGGVAGVDTTGFGKNNYTLYFNDGITFTFPKAAADCAEVSTTNAAAKKCYGLIDTNGAKSPNKVVQCNDDSNNTKGDACVVTNPTDIYPVVFYDQTILPSTSAGRAVLYGK